MAAKLKIVALKLARKHAKHVATQARQAREHISTSTLGTLACEHVNTQDT